MGAHDRVLDGGVLLSLLRLLLRRQMRPEDAHVIVQGDQRVDLVSGGLVEEVVGRAHVGPQGVSAERR